MARRQMYSSVSLWMDGYAIELVNLVACIHPPDEDTVVTEDKINESFITEAAKQVKDKYPDGEHILISSTLQRITDELIDEALNENG